MDRTPGWGRHDTGGGGGLGADRSLGGDPSTGSWVEQAESGGHSTGMGYSGVAAEAENLPSRLPEGYKLLRLVASGRHSTVALCRDEASGQELAVKLLHLTVEDDGTRLAAHSELLSAGSAAKHPCSVLVEDAGFTPDNHPYLVEQFCRGGNAQAKLLSSGPFPIDEVIVIGTRAALSIASSHRRGVLHLDVRPANILYDESGDALLNDHGVARVIQRSAPQLGTVFDPMYAAREMFGWEKPGPAADVYGLGATLYALLNGMPAYAEAGTTSWAALYNEVLRGELPPPNRYDVPPQLFDLVRRMMSVNPEGRPPLTEVHRELRQMLPGAYGTRVPALDPEPAPEPMLPGWDPADDVTPEEQAEAERIGKEAAAELKRRNRRRVLAAVTALVVFAGAATAMTVVLHQRKQDRDKKARAAASASASASAAAAATKGALKPVPASELPGLMPLGVSAKRTAHGVTVTWQPPKEASRVTTYAVQPVSAGKPGTPQNTHGKTVATFTDPDSTRAGTCFVAVTIIQSGADYLYAQAPQVCPAAARG